MAATSEPASDSSVRWTERSAPRATALFSVRPASEGAIVTATISSTSTAPPSRICMAASMAWVSNWLSVVSPERSRRLEFESMRFSTAASGTSFTRTQIFTESFSFVSS